jgi:carboxyl-terminal processing protease
MSDEPIESRRRLIALWPVSLVVSLGLLVAVVSFGGGVLSERYRFSPFGNGTVDGASDTASADSSLPRLAEVKALIEQEYYFRPASPVAKATFEAELERNAVRGMATAAAAAIPYASVPDYLRAMQFGAIQGMTDGLPDDYSTFLEPASEAPVAEQMTGQYEGIGVWVERRSDALTIVGVFPGSPAAEVRLQAGDVIEAANGQTLVGLAEEAGLKLIRGPVGTKVRLTVRRDGLPAPFDVNVERRGIVLPIVNYQVVGEGQVAWIQISIFNDQTTRQLDEALKRAKDEHVRGIVLDLRNNGGGWVTSAREVIGRFVPADRGPALYEDDNAAESGGLRGQAILNGGEETFDTPLVILVDGGTASAAEIVAGALRNYGRAELVGAPTFGKGLVQRVHDFDDGSSARITSAEWMTPKKERIPEDGLKPDIPARAAPGAPVGEDAQLDRAVEVVLLG